MALKNFIKQGTYLTFERIDYSKIGRYLQANIVVYADETKSEAILQTSIYIGGSYEALPIKKTIRTEDELMDEAPEYLGINTDEAILIAIDNPTSDYAKQIKEVHEMGVQIGIVIGGGNIFRGLSGSQKGFDRVKGDQMGMCATVINSLALSSALGALGVKNKVLTAIRMEPIGEFYTKWKAIEAMEAGYICIFSAGTGSPYFTTDTGSSLRGIEIEADVMLKGTRVDGIYTADPEKDPTATKFKDITYDEIYTKGLKVMDLTATTMCKENNLPIYVFNMDVVGNLKKVMDGEEIGTLVHN